MECTLEYIGLVNFVGYDYELLLGSEVNNFLNLGFREGGTGWVSWVDNNDGANIDAFVPGLFSSTLNGGDVGSP